MSITENTFKALDRAVLFEHIVEMGLVIMDAAGIKEGRNYMMKRIDETPELLNDEVIKGFYVILIKNSQS